MFIDDYLAKVEEIEEYHQRLTEMTAKYEDLKDDMKTEKDLRNRAEKAYREEAAKLKARIEELQNQVKSLEGQGRFSRLLSPGSHKKLPQSEVKEQESFKEPQIVRCCLKKSCSMLIL